MADSPRDWWHNEGWQVQAGSCHWAFIWNSNMLWEKGSLCPSEQNKSITATLWSMRSVSQISLKRLCFVSFTEVDSNVTTFHSIGSWQPFYIPVDLSAQLWPVHINAATNHHWICCFVFCCLEVFFGEWTLDSCSLCRGAKNNAAVDVFGLCRGVRTISVFQVSRLISQYVRLCV